MTTSQIPGVALQASAMASPLKTRIDSPITDSTDAARFTQALASAPPLPEHHLLNAAGKLANNTERLAERVALDDRALNDPVRLLAAQRDMTERVLALEAVAKVAGAATQGVNKLVHMQ